MAIVSDALDQISTDWESLTPPTRERVRYHEVDSKRFLDGSSGDRCFFYEAPNAALEDINHQIRWSCVAKIRIGSAGRSIKQLRRAVADEGFILKMSIDRRTIWPANVLSVITGEMSPEADEDSEDIILSLNFDALCIET